MEWQRIGRASFRQRVLLVSGAVGAPLTLYFLLYVGPTMTRLAFEDQPYPLRVVLTLGAAVLLWAVVVGIAALFFPGLQATPDGERVRIGRRELPAAAIDRAWLQTERATGPRQQLIVRLDAGRARTRLWLRAKQRVLLTEDERRLLVRVLEASSVQPPASPYDPDARFARYNFPGSLTKAEAIALVQEVPAPGERLPITD